MHMICVWKQRSETLRELLVRVRDTQEISDETKITYAGRLDPMAEGLVVLLTGSEVYEKERMLVLPKEYVVEVILGIGSDTDDVLGLIEVGRVPTPTKGELKKTLEGFVGSRQEQYPMYSSKTVAGKPLWQWHREGAIDQIDIPTHTETIDTLELISMTKKKSTTLLSKIKKDIIKVSGDFRQQEILERMESISFLLPAEFLVVKIRVAVRSGTYMRTLARRIGEALGVKSLAYTIVRTKVGDLTKEHCE
jgi:tRNA pseudouridine55 synthase